MSEDHSRSERVGTGPYRQGVTRLPLPPRVSRLAVASLVSCSAAYALAAYAAIKLDDDLDSWRSLTGLALALFFGAAGARAVASKRLKEHSELRGRTIVRVHKALLFATAGLAIAFAPYVLVLLLLLLVGDLSY